MKTQDMALIELGDRQLLVTRWFDAAPELVYRAHIDPEITARWMKPSEPGWTITIKDQGAGRHRYVWSHDGHDMGMTMRILESEPPRRMVHTELFDEDWTGGETRVETLFRAQDGGTLLDMTITYQSEEGRAMALKTPMADGMRASYDNLATLLQVA